MSPADTTPTTVLDCTLRDGGYYNNWDFAPDLVAAYLNVMRAISIDAVEIGFRTFPKSTFLGAHAFSSDDYLRSLSLPENARICVMINAADFIGYSDGPRGAVEFVGRPVDMNGDGNLDVLAACEDKQYAGCSFESTEDFCRGIAAVFHGPFTEDLTKADADLVIIGQPGHRFGHSIAAGDFNGDGHEDIAVGHMQDPHVSGSGSVNIYFGGPGALSGVVQASEYSVKVYAEPDSEWFGLTVAMADLDGDGFDDLATVTNYGKLFVVRGRPGRDDGFVSQ